MTYYYNAYNYEKLSEFKSVLYEEIKAVRKPYQNIILLCIGTDRATGDCLGPLVGHNLKNRNVESSNVYIYGTLDEPVHAKNLLEAVEMIKRLDNPFIITVDACLGKLENVGYVTFGPGPIRPGAGVNKQLPEIGNFHINGIVNMSGFMEFMLLQNTRLNLVMRMADYITKGLFYAIQNLKRERALL
ncbi:putative sporulation protein YyaC [Caldanaerobius fijiensis DSM 17918]|uniref:Putative sporulation protein YyaC n=1 Tax=Caldanaerobius fijiensis DSM 17918 TaxID=1121256 RepID=A0A1M5AR10_9THEO|nr:spore protease YyaC [Caldanaerobius fijiensis]SHF32596.1 putative sporulation protein YyaC [Caldanaerobius fijiensis DSM 17918]